MADDTYQAVIESVKVAQLATFMDPKSSKDDREEAHQIIRALGKIDDYIATVLTDEIIFDKNTK